MTLVPRVLDLLRQAGLGDVGMLVGGIIPEEDVAKLLELGVARVFGPGTVLEEISEFLRARVPLDHEQFFDRFAPGDRRGLSRLLTQAARGKGSRRSSTKKRTRPMFERMVRPGLSPSRVAVALARAH